MDVPIACRPPRGQILLLHRGAFLLELLHHSGHGHRVPDHHRRGHQSQTQGLMRQFLRILAPSLACLGDHEQGAESGYRCAFVELPRAPSSVVWVGIAAEELSRCEQAPRCLQGPGEGAFVGRGMERVDAERRGAPAQPGRPRHPEAVVPPGATAGAPDTPAPIGLTPRRALPSAGPRGVQALPSQGTPAWGETASHHSKERDDDLRIAMGVRRRPAHAVPGSWRNVSRTPGVSRIIWPRTGPPLCIGLVRVKVFDWLALVM
jgi:hypothetical protein